jgi:hypothetical protein
VTSQPRIPLLLCAQPATPLHRPRTCEYPGAVAELLGHLGVAHATAEAADVPALLPETGVLLTVGEVDLGEEGREALRGWVADGGAWLAVSGTCGLADLLGVDLEAASYAGWSGGIGCLGEGYLEPDPASDLCGDAPLPLHYFGGVPVRPHGALVHGQALDAHQRTTGRAALTESRNGGGVALLLAPDLAGTLVRIRQGVGVLRDGVPAPDGSGPVNDGALKSDDGIALDYWFDRQPVRGVPGLQAFQHPIADLWSEVLLRAILRCADRRGVCLPILWLYPRDLPALGHLSHDTDCNDPAAAERLVEILAGLGERSTWCVLLPGYTEETIARIREAGHELAMHYDAIEVETEWGRERFLAQHARLGEILGAPPVSNKNHYLRWEGDTDLWEWCLEAGIGLDQSKGPTKTGVAGFCFGTCHPYRPVTREGQVLDLLELPTVMQDFEVFIPQAFGEPLLRAALRTHGICHILFHPAHTVREEVASALEGIVRAGREAGLEWWPARDIAAWERARRSVRWAFHPDGLSIASDLDLADARLLVPDREGLTVSLDGTECSSEPVTRWGRPFRSVAVSLTPGRAVRMDAHLHEPEDVEGETD